MPKDDGMLIEKHSVADLFKLLGEIKVEVRKTNGRMTRMEGCSIGYWISQHQIKSFLIGAALLALTIPVLRDPAVNFLLKVVCRVGA